MRLLRVQSSCDVWWRDDDVEPLQRVFLIYYSYFHHVGSLFWRKSQSHTAAEGGKYSNAAFTPIFTNLMEWNNII